MQDVIPVFESLQCDEGKKYLSHYGTLRKYSDNRVLWEHIGLSSKSYWGVREHWKR